jgi:hypothetical protein
MANDSAVSTVPNFKVARVGKERKKRGAGFSWLGGSAKPGVWLGATGGAGAGAGAGAFGMTFAKTMLAIAVTALVGAGAAGLGMKNARKNRAAKPLEKPSVFAKSDAVQFEGDTANLPTTPNSIPNSLGFVSGSPDGLTPEERAKLAAEAEAKKKAEEEAARKAEEEAAAQDQTAGAGAPADPAAMMGAVAPGGKDSPFGKKFGQLSSSFGGQSSLSGGAGLSAGVARGFSTPSFNSPKGRDGQLSGMSNSSRVKMARASTARPAGSNVKGFARRQLANANALSRRGAAAGRGETAAYDASSAFDNNQGAGNVITGAGMGTGSRAAGETGDAPNPLNNGGPSGGGDPGYDCGLSHYMDANGACQPIKQGTKKSASQTVDTLAMIAQALLGIIMVISTIAIIADSSLIGAGVGGAMKVAIAAMGTIIGLLGLAIMAMGDYFTGAVFTAVGAFIGIASTNLLGLGLLTYSGAAIAAAAGMLLGQAAGALKGGGAQATN